MNEEEKNYFVHDSSFIDQNVEIGTGTKIWHFCHILENSKIGKDCSLGQNVMVGPNVQVGDSVKIQNNVSVYDGVTLEDKVFCGPSAVFTNVINPRSNVNRKEEFKKTIVKEGASIGANSTIICGNNLGKYCFIAAGSVITKDVPDFALMVGSPAKRVGWMSKKGEKLDESLTCPSDGSKYELINDNVLKEIE